MILRIFYDLQVNDLTIENQKKITIGSDIHDTFTINNKALKRRHIVFCVKKGDWFVKANGDVVCNGEFIKQLKLDKSQTFILSKSERIAVSVIEDTEKCDETIKLSPIDELTIGRDNNNNIVFYNKRVSNHHAKIYKMGSEYHIADIGSTNGTFLNNKIVRDAVLKNNDEIIIGKYTIIYKDNELHFKNIQNDLLIHNIQLKKRDIKKIPVFKRSPRLKLDMPSGEIDIQAAPSIGTKPEINWLSVLLPSVGMVAVMGAIGIISGNVSTLMYTAPMSMIGVLVSITSYNSQKKKYKSQVSLRIDKYSEYIDEVTAEIESNVNEQLKALTLSDPETNVCFNIAKNIERRLWERKPYDVDFASFRVGSGDTTFCMDIKVPNTNFTLEADDLANTPNQIMEKYKTIHGISVNYNAAQVPTCGVIGERRSAINVVKNIVVQAATQHSYDEMKIVTIFSPSEAESFEWIRWLPHSFDDDKEMRYMADSKSSANELFKHFEEIFTQRERELKEADTYKINKVKLPFYLFIISNAEFVDGHNIMKFLTSNNKGMSMASIFMFDDIGRLPDSCLQVIDVKNNKGFLYKTNNISAKTEFVVDDTNSFDYELFARYLAPIKVPQNDNAANLPSCVTFLEGYKVKTPNEIPVKKYWEESMTYKSLSVPIGVKSNGEAFNFDIHEKVHGPHGLVAGTTGSGKSEMVQSWILSMALHFSPNDVSFVLIDFKGTGLILPFTNLPHLAGTISDLDKNIKRNLIALENELSRRKEMLDKAGVNNINAYLKLYKENKLTEPMPYLFIVIDEFAEFKSQFPDFGATIDSILRTGRTLGVFSILLMQKPSGVVSDQSESNVKFRWCLKVATPADSREMLSTPDAAQISNAGRAYIKVSNEGAQDYVYELVQSYWSGAPYNPTRKEKATVKPRISVVDLLGKRIAYDVQEKTTGFKSDTNEIDVIVKHLKTISEKLEIKSKPIWDAKLPANIPLTDVKESIFDGDNWKESPELLCPAIGMVDDPKNQKQYPLLINFNKDGNLAIYGAPGTGKTTVLQTLIVSICTSYKPDEVSVYIMDFGSHILSLCKDFPHVGGIANNNDGEKIEKLVRMLTREMDMRKQKFAEEGVVNILSYRETTKNKIPYILLILDNFTPVLSLYPDLEDFFVTITREGGNYGIYFVTTSGNLMGLSYKISQNMTNAIALQMTDKSDYSQIVGRNEGLEPEKNPGRGLVKGNSPLEVQIALPVNAKTDGDRSARIREIAKNMDSHWDGKRPKSIPIMPDVIHYGSIETNKVAIGLSTQDIEPIDLDFESSHYLLISGKPQSGKSTMLKVISKQINADKTIIFDTNSALKAICDDKVEYYFEGDKFDECIMQLVPELEMRRKQYQAEGNSTFSSIAIIIDDLKQCFDSVSNDTIRRLFAITRIGKGLNIFLLAAGMYDDLLKLSNQGEQLTCGMIAGHQTIALGGCINDHEMFKVSNLSFNDKATTVDAYEGYLITREKALRFKAMYDK